MPIVGRGLLTLVFYQDPFHTMHPPFLLGRSSLLSNFKKGGRGLDRISVLRGGGWERGDDFFQEGGGEVAVFS